LQLARQFPSSLWKKPVEQFGGLALSQPGKLLLYTQRESEELYIMLVKNFR
jgi:hypothetical protein